MRNFGVQAEALTTNSEPIGSMDHMDNTGSGFRPHTHAYPKLMLAEAIIFTLVMGYFLFSNKSIIKKK